MEGSVVKNVLKKAHEYLKLKEKVSKLKEYEEERKEIGKEIKKIMSDEKATEFKEENIKIKIITSPKYCIPIEEATKIFSLDDLRTSGVLEIDMKKFESLLTLKKDSLNETQQKVVSEGSYKKTIPGAGTDRIDIELIEKKEKKEKVVSEVVEKMNVNKKEEAVGKLTEKVNLIEYALEEIKVEN